MDTLKFRLVKYDIFYNGQIQDSTECFMLILRLLIRAQYLVVFLSMIPRGFLYLIYYFHLCQKNILSAIYMD